MPLSKVMEQELLERIVGRSPSANYYIALCTSEPTVANTPKQIEESHETKYKGYKRFKTKGGTSSENTWAGASGEGPASIKNEKAIAFATYNPAGSGSETSSELKFFAIVTVELGETTSEKTILTGKLKATVVVSEGNPTAEWAAEALEVTLL